MSTKVIGDYIAANSIDGSTHYLLIQPGSSSTAYNKINRNVFLGITGQPMDINTIQTVSNKILDNTNTITVRDGVFTLQDDVDLTKQARFQLSGITTATTRTYTLPDASSTLVDISTLQTLTNKTLTNPVITGGSIDNTSITVDTIAGHTVAGNGTVYGLSVHSGVIQTSGAGGSTFLQTNAVQGNQLATNAITLGYAQIVTTFTGTTGTTTQAVTGLTTTVTIPSGGRKIKITAYASDLYSSTGGATLVLSIWDGTVGSGTQLAQGAVTTPSANTAMQAVVFAIVSPSAGSKVYNIGIKTQTSANVPNVDAINSSQPAFILVEAI